jgi:hypothetical protein
MWKASSSNNIVSSLLLDNCPDGFYTRRYFFHTSLRRFFHFNFSCIILLKTLFYNIFVERINNLKYFARGHAHYLTFVAQHICHHSLKFAGFPNHLISINCAFSYTTDSKIYTNDIFVFIMLTLYDDSLSTKPVL